MAFNSTKSRNSWKHSKIAYPYIDSPKYNSPKQLNYHQQHKRYSKGKSIQQDPKDKELETVMTLIHQFFDENTQKQDLMNGATKTDLCNFILKKQTDFTISKFRFALNQAIKLRLLETVAVSQHDGNKNEDCLSPRSSASIKIKIVDESGSEWIPERVSKWNNIEDEIEQIVELAINNKSSPKKQVKDIKCLFCNKLFCNDRSLRQHLMQSHYQAMGYRFKCDKCTHKFKTDNALNDHLAIIHSQ